MKNLIEDFIAQVASKNPNEPEFIQAVTEVADSDPIHSSERAVPKQKVIRAHGRA